MDVIIAVLLSLLVSCSLSAQHQPTVIPDLMHPTMDDAGKQALHFLTDTYEVDTLSEDDTIQVYTFKGYNASNQPLTITKVQATCGCTTAGTTSTLLQPGDTVSIEVKFNPYGQAGKLFNRVFIYSSLSSKSPAAALTLLGSVTPSAALWRDYRFAAGALRLRSKEVKFGKVNAAMKRKERIACVNSGTTKLEVKAEMLTLPKWLNVQTLPKILMPGETGVLEFAIMGDKLSSAIIGKQQVSVLLKGLSARPSERTIKVTIEIEKVINK